MTDAFKELEVAGWREPGRGVAYDAVVGRVTARVAEPLLDAVGVRAGTSLLDVGTGTGHVAGAAAARGAHGVGIDISEEMLARARAMYPRVDFRRADAESLPFEDGAFDAVVVNRRRNSSSRASRSREGPTAWPIGGSDAAAEYALPQLVGAAHRLDEGNGVDPDGGESRSFNTRATVLAQPPAVQQRIREELARLVDPHRREDGIDVPVSVRIASGRRD